MRAYIIVAATCLGLLLVSASSYSAEAPKTLYTNRCQGCHGPDGKGSPTMAKALQTTIPDLTSNEIGKKPDAEILGALSKGRGKMPPATGLSEKELKDLLGYIKGLARGK